MSSFWNSPAWTMSQKYHSTDNIKLSDYRPGPGNYNLQNDVANKKQGWKIGTSNRNHDSYTNVPGPGKYDFNFSKSGPKISMASKPKTNERDSFIPGPGNYNVKD
jgi:hypothetical protein